MADGDAQDSPMARALKDRKELQETIRVATQKLEKIEQFINMLRRYTTTDADQEKGALLLDTVDHPTKGAPTSQADFVRMVRALLLEFGRPMASPEIMEKFRERGQPFARSNEVKQTWNKLWLAKKEGHLINIPRLGYWLPDELLSDEARAASEEARVAQLAHRKPRQKKGQGRRPKPWAGKPARRPALFNDDQLAKAEQWILEGKMTRVQIADRLGVSMTLVNYHFSGGIERIRQRRSTPVDLLLERDARREAALLRLQLQDSDLRQELPDGQTTSDAEHEELWSRLSEIERRFPESKKIRS